ncbi:MAG: tetratricopeptide repeat protein, partial [Planctomycetia bacterium]
MSAVGDGPGFQGQHVESWLRPRGRGGSLPWAVAAVLIGGLAWLTWRPLVAGVVSLQADRAQARRDFDQAVDLLERLERLEPGAARATFELGRARRRRGDLVAADTLFTRALERGWEKRDIATQRLLAEAQCGDIKDVEPAIESLVAAGAGDEIAEECYEAIVQGYLNCMRPEKAAECLDYWSRWQPRNPLVAYWRGRLHEQAEEWATALAHYRESLELAPWRYATLVAVARMERETAAVEAASGRFSICRSWRPDDPVAALGLADCRLRLGDREGAARLLRESLTLELTPDEEAAALANLAELSL